MLRFIELTHINGSKLYLNLSSIEAVEPDGSGSCIYTTTGNHCIVLESYKRVKELIRWSSHRVE